MEFRAALGVWDRAANLDLEPGASLHETVFPRPGFGEEKQKSDLARLTATQWAQPAIACVSLSQLALLEEIGIRADLTGGHSLGEVVALRAAGVLSSDADLLTVARRRGELMAEAAAIPGAMTALSLPVGKVRELLARLAPRVVVANHNGPTQVVVSGATADVADLEAKLSAEGISFQRLPVATAFHSGLVSGACEPFARFLSDVPFASPTIPVYSNALAAPHGNDARRPAVRAGEPDRDRGPLRRDGRGDVRRRRPHVPRGRPRLRPHGTAGTDPRRAAPPRREPRPEGEGRRRVAPARPGAARGRGRDDVAREALLRNAACRNRRRPPRPRSSPSRSTAATTESSIPRRAAPRRSRPRTRRVPCSPCCRPPPLRRFPLRQHHVRSS